MRCCLDSRLRGLHLLQPAGVTRNVPLGFKGVEWSYLIPTLDFYSNFSKKSTSPVYFNAEKIGKCSFLIAFYLLQKDIFST